MVSGDDFILYKTGGTAAEGYSIEESESNGVKYVNLKVLHIVRVAKYFSVLVTLVTFAFPPFILCIWNQLHLFHNFQIQL